MSDPDTAAADPIFWMHHANFSTTPAGSGTTAHGATFRTYP